MAEAPWLEISLIVDGEMAEAVAEVLSRYIPDGIVLESIEIPDTSEETVQPVGPIRVSGYLPVDEEVDEIRQKIEEGIWHLAQISPIPAPKFRTIQDANWMETWKENYRPIPVGEKLIILPAWIDNPKPDRIPIKIDPGMAFGTGVHPTTQLSLQLLEKYVQPGETVIDVGCGSGILSIASHKLGAEAVFGVDVDGQAVDNARENRKKNGLGEDVVFETGSVSEIKAGILPVLAAPVVVANILAHILIQLLDEGLADLLTLGGVLLLSGILDEHEAGMMTSLERHCLKVQERKQMGDWIGLAVTRP